MDNASEMSIKDIEEIPDNMTWDLHAKFDIECDRIKSWIKNKAQHNLGSDRSTENIAKAKSLVGGVVESIKTTFYDTNVSYNPDLAAEVNKILQSRPDDFTITKWKWIRNIAIFLEMIVFGIQFLLEFEEWGQLVIFVPATILAIGALFAGYGLAYIILSKEIKKGEDKKKRIILFIGGVIGIILATGLRAWKAKQVYFVSIFTLGLGVLIVAAETIYVDYKTTREYNRRMVYTVQVMSAASRHIDLFNDKYWEKVYIHEIDTIVKKIAEC